MTEHIITCDEFETHLGEYLEGGLDSASRLACVRHESTCASCGALVRELQHIVASAHALPLPAPQSDLWPSIEARLETAVLAMPTRQANRVAPANLSWRRLAVAAAFLVTLSAGVTWNVARRAPTGTAAAPTTVAAATDEPVSSTIPTSPAVGGAENQTADPGRANAITDAAPSVMGGALGRSALQSGVVASAAAPANSAGSVPTRVVLNETRAFAIDTLYGREIALLRTVAEEQLGLLDSTTVAVVRRNLDIIDRAIMESRAALGNDPNSGFLLDQLDRAYERKVDLLRRLALL